MAVHTGLRPLQERGAGPAMAFTRSYPYNGLNWAAKVLLICEEAKKSGALRARSLSPRATPILRGLLPSSEAHSRSPRAAPILRGLLPLLLFETHSLSPRAAPILQGPLPLPLSETLSLSPSPAPSLRGRSRSLSDPQAAGVEPPFHPPVSE